MITRLIVGGAQEATLLACARVDAESFESSLVSGPQAGTEGSLRTRADELGVPVVVIPSLVRQIAPGSDLRAARALRHLFRTHRPDVVHTHSSKAGVLGRWAAHREQVPTIVHTVHGWSFHEHMPAWMRAAYVHLERRAARWCHRIVTVSEIDRRKGLAAGIGSPEQYVTIHELNDLAPFEQHAGERAEARRRLGLPVDVPVVGTVGRLSEQKDPQTWVGAAALVAQRRQDVRFVMVGDGPLRSDVERMADDAGIAGQLVTTGIRDDVPAVLPAFDLFLLTSRWEGLPLVIPQAMAAGVPVVASDADGNREIIRDGENGIRVSAGNMQAIAGAVLRILEDAELRRRVMAGGRHTAGEFSLPKTVGQLEGLYRGRVASGLDRNGAITRP